MWLHATAMLKWWAVHHVAACYCHVAVVGGTPCGCMLLSCCSGGQYTIWLHATYRHTALCPDGQPACLPAYLCSYTLTSKLPELIPFLVYVAVRV